MHAPTTVREMLDRCRENAQNNTERLRTIEYHTIIILLCNNSRVFLVIFYKKYTKN